MSNHVLPFNRCRLEIRFN